MIKKLIGLSGLGTVLALALGASGAQALTQDVIEVQLDAVEFGKLIRQAVIDQAACPRRLSCAGGEIGPDGPENSDPCYIDHVDVPDAGAFRFASETSDLEVGASNVVPNVRGIEFVQPTLVHAKSAACVFDADCPVDEFIRTVEADLVLGFSLEFEPDRLEALELDQPAVCASLADVEGEVSAMERAVLRLAMAEPICRPLPTESLAALVGDREMVRAGIALRANLEDLAMRFEFASVDPADGPKPFELGAWRAFLEGSLAPMIDNRGLGLMIQKHVLVNTFSDQLDPSSDPNLNSDGSTTARWMAHGHGGATLELTTPVEIVVDVCPDIDTDIITTADFSFDARERQMIVDLKVETDLSFLDKTVCGALIGAPIGPFDWAMREGLIQILASAFTPTMGDKVAESTKNREAGGDGQIPEECVATADDRLRCRFDVQLPSLSFGGDASAPQLVQGLFGDAEGLVLFGRFRTLGDFDPWFLETSEIPIQWSLSNTSCYSGGESESFAGAISLIGRGRVCGQAIAHDPDDVYAIEETATSRALPKQYIVHVVDEDFVRTTGADWTAPYDFEMTVFTTIGSQTVSLEAPSYDAAAAASAELEMQMATEVNCTTAAPSGLDNLYGVDTPESVINPAEQVYSPIEEVATSPTPTRTTTAVSTSTKSALDGATSTAGALRLR